MIQTIEVKGSDYEMGFQIGGIFKEYLQKTIPKYEEKLKDKTAYLKVKNMEKQLKNTLPNCLDEIIGRADGAGVSRDAMLLMFFPEIYKGLDGCTTLILKKRNGNFLFAHNEDDFNFNIENIALVKYNYGDYWVVGYTMAERLTGSAFSYNSYGMIFSCNYIYGTKFNIDNISRYILVREIIKLKDIDDIIKLLQKTKTASAFSINILDKNKKVAVNIEKDIDQIYVTNITDRYARSNHFLAKPIIEQEVPKNTIFRSKKAHELLIQVNNESATINDLINILNFKTEKREESIFKEPDPLNKKGITVANFSFDSETDEIQIIDYVGKHTFKF